MPKVRASSATIGTTRGPSVASFSSAVSMRTKAIVVLISLPSALQREVAVALERRHRQRRRGRAAAPGM